MHYIRFFYCFMQYYFYFFRKNADFYAKSIDL